jgi:transcriptional regulator with XRE-family HTH domain
MASREQLRTVGVQRAAAVVGRLGSDVRTLRLASGITQCTLASSAGISREHLCRIELGRVRRVNLETACILFALLGQRLSIKGYPVGDPLRDAGQLRLLNRFDRRIPPTWRRRRESPMPIPGDLRAWDELLIGPVTIGVEAETRAHDIQATERSMALKKRDSGVQRMALLLASTTHNEVVVRAHLAELRQTFPLDTRGFMGAIRDGRDPGADALVLI